MKRMMSLLLSVMMVMSLFSLTVHAQEAEGKNLLYKDKFYERYNFELDEPHEVYDELYYHHTPSGEIDWVLVYGWMPIASPWEVSAELNGYVLTNANQDYPFSFDIGIYDVAADKFIDVFEAAQTGRYPQLKENFRYGRPIGDIDGDREVTILDATCIQRCLADLDKFSEYDTVSGYPLYGNVPRYYSDADRDGERTITDATRIQRILADLYHEPNYIKTIGDTDSLYVVDGEEVPFTELEKSLNEDPTSMRAAQRSAVIRSAEEYADFTGEKSDVYNDAYFADHALYVLQANVSDTIGAFSLKAMTFDGVRLYPELSYSGYDGARSSGYQLYDTIYEIPRDVAEKVQVLIPLENKDLLYPRYNTYIDEFAVPDEARSLSFETVASGDYTGSDKSLARYNTVSNTILTSPYELKDFLGITDDRYDDAFFEEKSLYAAVIKGRTGQTYCYNYTVSAIDYLDGTLHVAYDMEEVTPNDHQNRYVLCEIDKIAADTIKNIHTYMAEAGRSIGIKTGYQERTSAKYSQLKGSYEASLRSSLKDEDLYVPENHQNLTVVIRTYEEYLNCPVKEYIDGEYDEEFFKNNKLIFLYRRLTCAPDTEPVITKAQVVASSLNIWYETTKSGSGDDVTADYNFTIVSQNGKTIYDSDFTLAAFWHYEK